MSTEPRVSATGSTCLWGEFNTLASRGEGSSTQVSPVQLAKVAEALSALRTSPWTTSRKPIVGSHIVIFMLFEYSMAFYFATMLIKLRAPGLFRLLPETPGAGADGANGLFRGEERSLASQSFS